MKRTISVVLILFIVLFSSSSFAKISITKTRTTITKRLEDTRYKYRHNHKDKTAILTIKFRNHRVWVKIDKKSRPQHISMSSYPETFFTLFPKNNSKNILLYTDMQIHIKWFLKYFRIKQILKKYKTRR